MELIHADSNFSEIGYIENFIKYDACVELNHDGDNNWQLDIDSDEWRKSPIEVGHYIYIEGTEYGGPVEKLKHISSSNTIQLSGPLWRGMLARQVIFPDSGSAYKTISNTEANKGISELLNGSLGELFTVSADNTGLSVSGKFRYPLLLEGINAMLDTSLRLEIELDVNEDYSSIPCRVILSAKPAADWSKTIEFSQDYDANITSEAFIPQFNHVVALGQGELTERTVIELWLLPDGSITSDKTAEGVPVGTACRSFVYDYSSVESAEELTKSATDKLKEYATEAGIEIDLSGADVDIPLGDYVGLRDHITGLSATQRVAKKILTISTAQGAVIAHYVS